MNPETKSALQDRVRRLEQRRPNLVDELNEAEGEHARKLSSLTRLDRELAALREDIGIDDPSHMGGFHTGRAGVPTGFGGFPIGDEPVAGIDAVSSAS